LFACNRKCNLFDPSSSRFCQLKHIFVPTVELSSNCDFVSEVCLDPELKVKISSRLNYRDINRFL
jgi:hypothetical protein